MFELIFMLFVIPPRIRKAARPRGKSTLAWSLLAIAAWTAAETVTFLAILAAVTVCNFYLGMPNDHWARIFVLVGYLPALALGMMAAERVRERLERETTPAPAA